jgi:hypothetical protein
LRAARALSIASIGKGFAMRSDFIAVPPHHYAPWAWRLYFLLLALVFLATLAAGCAVAADERKPLHKYQEGDTRVQLFDAPCVGKVSQMVPPQIVAQLRAADGDFLILDGPDRGKVNHYEGCWMEDAGGVVILFEDGDMYQVPLSVFKNSGRPKGALDA